MQRTTFADVMASQQAAFAAGTLQSKPKKSKTKDLVAQMEVMQLEDAAAAPAPAPAFMEAKEEKDKMLRIFQGDTHYTAIHLKDGAILEVKGPRARGGYESVDAWVASIPGATLVDVQVSDNKPKEPKEKEKKEKKRKHEEKKCNVPARTPKFRSSRWMKHVYEMMVESRLVLTEEIVDAFNDLMDFLVLQNDKMTTATPPKFNRYVYGIKVEKLQHNIRGIYLNFEHTVGLAERTQICDRIVDLYAVLFALIKDTVVPFMEKKNIYLTAKKDYEHEKLHLMKCHDTLEKELYTHAVRIEGYRNMLARTQKMIDTHEAVMRKFSDYA
jgi:hypothetical protein